MDEVVLNMTRFLSQLGEEVYAQCFSPDRKGVKPSINPTPRVDLVRVRDMMDLLRVGVF